MRVFGYIFAVGLVVVGIQLVPAHAAEAPTSEVVVSTTSFSGAVGVFND